MADASTTCGKIARRFSIIEAAPRKMSLRARRMVDALRVASLRANRWIAAGKELSTHIRPRVGATNNGKSFNRGRYKRRCCGARLLRSPVAIRPTAGAGERQTPCDTFIRRRRMGPRLVLARCCIAGRGSRVVRRISQPVAACCAGARSNDCL
jgi:hypothetical protein